ncbi:LCP family protein [Bacillus solimangrovi]|uniref:Regulatory protein MsrR n=1 Tax=Bacillus solimangrovi TaxID=1305675 RepID=A0A1E5LC04_9BACI|nr:LCP family protein [Bacillus solimangrovi]OEH91628.1 transcriptional regulator [Bacillus solimangrovi]
MASTRIVRRKKRKNKKKFRLLLFFILFFGTAIGYSAYEFNVGARGNDDDINSEVPEVEEPEFKGSENEFGKTNILLLGTDTTSAKGGRTDTIMIAQYDPENGTAKLASIMRDSYVSIPGYGYNKMNTAYVFGGAELVRQTIKENFNIDVQYYALVNFDGFTEIVDELAPKGIDIDVEKSMNYVDRAGGLYIDLQEGQQKLDGEQLLHYARFRHDSESDFGRVRRQQQVIEAVKDELISVKGVLKLPRMLGMIQPYLKTDISEVEMLGLGKDFLLNTPDNIETLRIPIDGTYSNSYYEHAGSVLALDESENRQALDEFFNSDNTQTAINDAEDEPNS